MCRLKSALSCCHIIQEKLCAEADQMKAIQPSRNEAENDVRRDKNVPYKTCTF